MGVFTSFMKKNSILYGNPACPAAPLHAAGSKFFRPNPDDVAVIPFKYVQTCNKPWRVCRGFLPKSNLCLKPRSRLPLRCRISCARPAQPAAKKQTGPRRCFPPLACLPVYPGIFPALFFRLYFFELRQHRTISAGRLKHRCGIAPKIIPARSGR